MNNTIIVNGVNVTDELDLLREEIRSTNALVVMLARENEKLRELVRDGVELAIGPDSDEHSDKVFNWCDRANEMLDAKAK